MPEIEQGGFRMITVNSMGDACPIPVIKTKKALQELQGADVLEVLVDNEIAVQNVTKLAESQGAKVVSQQSGEKEYKVIITVGEAADKNTAEEHTVSQGSCCCSQEKDMVVVISSDRMGEGNDKLGTVLMKGFIFAVSKLDKLPSAILFYNGGAKLTAEGSDSLTDLQEMLDQGVEIMTCGTCLDYYELKDKLKVGTVTNMYSIVETMNNADQIIRP